MIRGWYIGASGMNAQQHRLDTISNNLANVDTAGYKRDVTVHKTFSELLIRRANFDGVYEVQDGSCDDAPVLGTLGLGVETNENYTDFSQGSFKVTGRKQDVALNGEGFYVVDTPYGERYTRNGDFFIGKEGYLETKEGYPLMGEKGYIYVVDDKFNVNKDGVLVNEEDGTEIDRFKVVRFDNERYLEKMGQNLYATNDISGPAHIAESFERPQFIQGYTETSNVNVVNEMVQMIEVNRAYEANQKTITSEDSMMQTLWSKVAVLR
jgi:flagellar basal-body rod protein FlgG